MKSVALLGLAVAVLAVTAVASPWVALALASLSGHPFSFPRVYDRVFEVVLVVAVVLAWRPLDLGGPAALGFRRRGWARELGRGFLVGITSLAVALAVCAWLGALEPALRFPPLKTVRKALLGLGAAIAIGVGEEALFRGVLLRRIGRDLGMVAAVVVTTAIYAAVHLVRARGGYTTVHADSGIAQTLVLFAPLTRPDAVPQLVGLGFLGLLLAAARLRTGALWVPIGIHAAFVAAFRVGRLFFAIAPGPAWLVGSGWPPLIGGATGWIAVAIAAFLLAYPVAATRPATPPSSGRGR